MSYASERRKKQRKERAKKKQGLVPAAVLAFWNITEDNPLTKTCVTAKDGRPINRSLTADEVVRLRGNKRYKAVEIVDDMPEPADN